MFQIRSGVNDCIYFIAGQNSRKIALSFHSRNSVIIPDSLQHLFYIRTLLQTDSDCEFQETFLQTFGCKKTFRIFKRKIRNVFSNPTKEVTDIRAIQLNSSFTQVTFFRFIADRFKKYLLYIIKTSRISSVNNYIYLFGGALAS